MLYELRACQISVVYCAHMTKLSKPFVDNRYNPSGLCI